MSKWMARKRICLESPYASNGPALSNIMFGKKLADLTDEERERMQADPRFHTVEDNIHFAQRCAAFIVKNGFNVTASHLFFTQFLDDENPRQRAQGIQLGYEWLLLCHEAWFFKRVNEEPSGGMLAALQFCIQVGKPVKFFDVTPEFKFISVVGEKRVALIEGKEKEVLGENVPSDAPIISLNGGNDG